MPTNLFAEVAAFLGCPGWPDDYVVVDFETNGLAVNSPATLPVEYGAVMVSKGKITAHVTGLLNWCHPSYGNSLTWLAESLERTRAGMEARGNKYPFTVEMMQEEGVDPREALTTLMEVMDDSPYVVGHNHIGFDLPIMVRCLRDHCGIEFSVPHIRCIDTGLIEVSRQLGRPIPLPGTVSARDWYESVDRMRRKFKWSLSTVAAYHGIAMDQDQAHGAAYDCEVTHKIVQKMRELSGVCDGEEGRGQTQGRSKVVA